jgi:hypothetical protein
MIRHVALARTDVSKERNASIIRVARIGELGTTLAVTNRRTLVTLMMEALSSSETLVLTPHGVTAQKAAFLIVTVVKTSNLT